MTERIHLFGACKAEKSLGWYPPLYEAQESMFSLFPVFHSPLIFLQSQPPTSLVQALSHHRAYIIVGHGQQEHIAVMENCLCPLSDSSQVIDI